MNSNQGMIRMKKKRKKKTGKKLL